MVQNICIILAIIFVLIADWRLWQRMENCHKEEIEDFKRSLDCYENNQIALIDEVQEHGRHLSFMDEELRDLREKINPPKETVTYPFDSEPSTFPDV